MMQAGARGRALHDVFSALVQLVAATVGEQAGAAPAPGSIRFPGAVSGVRPPSPQVLAQATFGRGPTTAFEPREQTGTAAVQETLVVSLYTAVYAELCDEGMRGRQFLSDAMWLCQLFLVSIGGLALSDVLRAMSSDCQLMPVFSMPARRMPGGADSVVY